MSENTESKELNKNKKSDVALAEEATLLSWEEKDIFKKTLLKNEGNKEFVFYDGPPFATGLPHYGHLLPGTIKDVIPRFQTMNGKHVKRRWGWDCHGLPIENLVEKELGLGSKKDIEKLGVESFNEAARNVVFRYVDEWKKIIPRTGRFVNMDNAYTTMDAGYTESVWWSFKELFDKDLIYEGYKVMPYCPRCETTLSNFEVNLGYKDITDLSAYVKFPIVGRENTFLIAWTTTPWTLPGNVALAINPDFKYVEISVGDSVCILAKDLLSKVKEPYTVMKEFSGKDILGLSYVPPFNYFKDSVDKNIKNAWKVYGASFVTAEDGTGIVHIAPAFGADDYELSVKEHLPVISHISSNGSFLDEVSDFKNLQVKPKDDHQKTDIEIIKYLAHKNLLFAKEKIVHSYPHCWRCDTPLLNFAHSSWFVKVTAIKDKLVSENKKIVWNPENIRDGRFGKWLDGAKDWAISRSRYWGAPLPVWKCHSCKKTKVIGSFKELKNTQKERNTFFLMRHAEAENNVQNIISSNLSVKHKLTQKGIDQAKAAAKKLIGEGITTIYTSPFERTLETAKIVAEILGLPKESVIVDPHLKEIDAGEFNGKKVSEYHSFFSNDHERFIKRPKNGETYADVKVRISKFIYQINNKYKNQKILIVSHDSPLWLLCAGINALSESETITLRGKTNFFFNNAEVRKLGVVEMPHNKRFELDVHRPYIDEITLDCECGSEMRRISEVFDTWYDSGSMPFASNNYPFKSSQNFNPKSVPFFKKSSGFPADLIAESLDQTRGWFYTLLVLSVGLFGKSPFKHVNVSGLILAEDGKKMAKKLGNYPALSHIIDKYGADALRYYLMSSPSVRAEDLCFSERGVDEVYKKLILRLDNVVAFYSMYKKENEIIEANLSSKNVLDQWIIARLAETISKMTNSLMKSEIDKGAWPIESFIDDISTWYLRRSRDRLKGDNLAQRKEALETIKYTLTEFSKAIAPYLPFIADRIYLKLGNILESVHLESWPKESIVSSEILDSMSETRKIVTQALDARTKAGIKVRQPLKSLTIIYNQSSFSLKKDYLELIKDEVNVKDVFVEFSKNETGSDQSGTVALDTNITPELRLEGLYREVLRAAQELRKKHNLYPEDRVSIVIDGGDDVVKSVNSFESTFKQSAGIEKIIFKKLDKAEKISIDGEFFALEIIK